MPDLISAPPGAALPHHGEAQLTPTSNHLLPRAEAAELMGVSQRTVRRLVRSGDLEEVWITPQLPRITPDSLARHLERNLRRRVVEGAVSAA